MIPTSNHNDALQMPEYLGLYIFWFLHQTTTFILRTIFKICCISFDSYIKPQQNSFKSSNINVVYLLIPTSNHNLYLIRLCIRKLYIFWFLHQTTTPYFNTSFEDELYIFWFLHQTTTLQVVSRLMICCISFDSYIKPQRFFGWCIYKWVVYLLIPTSNHNVLPAAQTFFGLYIFWFLHQTTTQQGEKIDGISLYIFWFLHQTTTDNDIGAFRNSCISFDSYIKPQHINGILSLISVVYLLIPTSNHNLL